ncbi:SDR family NAD(P)-dependent oxidoreductase [Siccirubricoccus deserti]
MPADNRIDHDAIGGSGPACPAARQGDRISARRCIRWPRLSSSARGRAFRLLARLLSREGYGVALAARNPGKLAALAAETGATTHQTDAADAAEIAALFAAEGDAEVVVYNPSYRTRGPIAELDPAEVQKSLQVCAFGAFLAVREAVRRMEPAGRGTILLTGASAGVKGYPMSAPFAMGNRPARAGPVRGAGTPSEGRPCRPHRHRRRHPQRPAAGERRSDAAGPGRDRRDLPAPDPPAAQRLVLGDRGPTLGGAVLNNSR